MKVLYVPSVVPIIYSTLDLTPPYKKMYINDLPQNTHCMDGTCEYTCYYRNDIKLLVGGYIDIVCQAC